MQRCLQTDHFDRLACQSCPLFKAEETKVLRRCDSAFDAAFDMAEFAENCYKTRAEKLAYIAQRYIIESRCDYYGNEPWLIVYDKETDTHLIDGRSFMKFKTSEEVYDFLMGE